MTDLTYADDIMTAVDLIADAACIVQHAPCGTAQLYWKDQPSATHHAVSWAAELHRMRAEMVAFSTWIVANKKYGNHPECVTHEAL